ncbi:unnamed protein product (macronuclear) [Paramecium tetraurelia]|uniref:Uncharacterized protein n=1 Tax=Paramecium tetraurelia TaxID=5888 RepID=A0BVJ0_PARTE|nr:uncharacterized protein GSPATT00005803001 [Paramecium tetraurelia]CAK62557.1 unnamed protein product [Paramecium tetraurelia]|eukprot:XP_001429955.1 hypothetical protein (macronuclear) [Paramecium tetraurelia strain d4-2]
MKIILLVLVLQVFSQSCLSSTGTQVDWWLIFKLPADSAIPYSGFEYYYCDSQNDCSGMNLMSDDLRDRTSPLQRTVGQISFTSSTTMNVVWNDQPYGKSTISDRAHSKGILSASSSGQGFIINHSTPQFPVFDESQSNIIPGMPSSANVNGQHYFCVTMTTSQINVVAEQYIIAQTLTQKANEISTFESTYPNIFALRNNSRNIQAQSGSKQVKSKNGLSILVISKNQNLVEDFYANIVAPNLKVGLVMETWGNGTGGLQEPSCSQTYQTYSNIYRNHNGYKFKYTKDHSKFGISAQSAMPYVCMADLNRMTTQNKRGGTTFCFLHSKIWNVINKAFVERQTC